MQPSRQDAEATEDTHPQRIITRITSFTSSFHQRTDDQNIYRCTVRNTYHCTVREIRTIVLLEIPTKGLVGLGSPEDLLEPRLALTEQGSIPAIRDFSLSKPIATTRKTIVATARPSSLSVTALFKSTGFFYKNPWTLTPLPPKTHCTQNITNIQ